MKQHYLKVLNLLLCTLFFYSLNAQTWNQLGLDIDGESVLDQSGYSVSLSSDGNTVAIGAPNDDGNGSNSGHTRIYEWDGSAWNQLGDDIDGEAAGDQSGWSVSLSADGNTVAIGAVGNDGNGSNSGHTRIYQWDGSAWNQLGGDIDGELTDDESGFSVSLNTDGTIVAIGARENNGNGNDSGHARIYQWDGSAWNQLGGDIDGEGANEQSGRSVSLSANGFTLAIGAPFNSGNGFASGHTRIYQWDGSDWNQLGDDIDGEASGDQSGFSVDISANGSIVAIGAPFNGLNAGQTRIYQWDGSAWSQLGGDINSEANFDRSGWSISLSADGSTVAIGASENNGNGSNSGHTRIFEWDGAWNQLGGDIDGEGANEQSGWSVSLSANATTVAIGAWLNDANGNNSGHTRVYRLQLPSNTWTGATSTDWDTASNWSEGSVPSSTDAIIIPDVSGASGNFPVAATDVVSSNLTIEANATLDIQPGFGLINNSGMITNNGTLTLNADATDAAYYDDFTNGGSFVGNITVEQYITPGSGFGQRMFGSPVQNGVVQGLDMTYAGGSNGQIQMSDCGTAQVDVGSPYSNLFEWEEAIASPNNCSYEGWVARSSAAALETGRGYSGWMNDGSTISFTGAPNTGTVLYGGGLLTNSGSGLANKDGWHVLSNPYPSPVNINSITIIGWTSPQTYDAGQAFGGTFQPINPAQNLAVMQGFVAQTTFLGNAFGLQSSDRVAVAGVQFKNNQNWYSSKLDITVAGNGKQDISYIYFNQDATSAFDNQWDCVKRSSDPGVPTLYTLINGEPSSLNGNNVSELGNYSIPLGLKPEADATFIFTVTGIETLPATTMAYLEDKATGTWTNLRESNTYSFDMTLSENEERFEVHFTKPIALAALAESCAQDDGTVAIDFGNQSIQGNSVVWEYAITLDNETIASGAASNVVELDQLAAGEYEVILTNGNYETTETVLVEDKEPVEANFETVAAITEGDEVVFNNLSIGATDYIWTINGEIQNTSDASYIFEMPGTYTITLEASNEDCDASYSKTIEVAEKAITISSIDNLDNLNNILVYTDNNTIVVDLSNADLQGKTEVEVYDLVGQLIATKVTQQELLSIELSNKAAGFYLVHIVNNGKQTTEKVFIK